MERVIRACLAAASVPQATTTHYFLANAVWEAEMRRNFATLRGELARSVTAARQRGVQSLKRLNGDYRTRHSRPREFPELYDDIVASIEEKGWWKNTAPDVLTCSEAQLADISAVIREILNRVAARRGVRAYSLITKWLHFCFPSTFVIFDWQAAASVQAWSDQAFANLRQSDPVRRRYQGRILGAYDGTGYLGLLNFYRALWNTALRTGLDTELSNAGIRLTMLLENIPGTETAVVPVVDVVDKLLWRANGHPAVLGLA